MRGKLACTVLAGGKAGDNFKGLPIGICHRLDKRRNIGTLGQHSRLGGGCNYRRNLGHNVHLAVQFDLRCNRRFIRVYQRKHIGHFQPCVGEIVHNAVL